jgi:phosphoglycolate phosphatase-like HAD superfamily hydrolase
VEKRGVKLPDMTALNRFVNSGKPLGNPALIEEVAITGDADLKIALQWSEAVNQDIARMVHGVHPFPGVRECLEMVAPQADVMVVSATPSAALHAEWEEHDLCKHVALISGQESGSKKDILKIAAAAGYEANHVLMVGDAPGDLKAARSTGALFFPIVPGDEDASWASLLDEGLDRFFAGTFAGEYEAGLVKRFLAKLPSTPPWKK